MGKRGKRQRSARPQEELDASTKLEDLISKLPDDILVDIISRLNLEEAARTSSLSSRWKYLWNFSTVLNFDAPRKLPMTRLLSDLRKNKYVGWVNEVLKLHRGASINEFGICFELGGSHETVITDWINTVIAKRVQKLELNLGNRGKKYTFPQEWNNIPETPHGLAGGNGVQLKNLIEPVRSYLTQLETLELHLDLLKDDVRFPICELLKLRHLTFDISGPESKNLHELTGIIHACPFLQKLTLKFLRIYVGYGGRRKVRTFPKCSHQRLKVVEVIGFVGLPFDLELPCYLLENAVRLEKMIVNPTNPLSLAKYWEYEDDGDKKIARKRAKKLEAKVPQGVEFVIC